MTRCHEKPGIFPDGISGLTQRRKRKAETYGYIRLAEFSHTKKGMVKDVDGKYFKHNICSPGNDSEALLFDYK